MSTTYSLYNSESHDWAELLTQATQELSKPNPEFLGEHENGMVRLMSSEEIKEPGYNKLSLSEITQKSRTMISEATEQEASKIARGLELLARAESKKDPSLLGVFLRSIQWGLIASVFFSSVGVMLGDYLDKQDEVLQARLLAQSVNPPLNYEVLERSCEKLAQDDPRATIEPNVYVAMISYKHAEPQSPPLQLVDFLGEKLKGFLILRLKCALQDQYPNIETEAQAYKIKVVDVSETTDSVTIKTIAKIKSGPLSTAIVKSTLSFDLKTEKDKVFIENCKSNYQLV